MTYSAGDYLAILPTNPVQSIKRVLKHFNLSEEVSLTPEREIEESKGFHP